jgi:hypothetical protein
MSIYSEWHRPLLCEPVHFHLFDFVKPNPPEPPSGGSVVSGWVMLQLSLLQPLEARQVREIYDLESIYQHGRHDRTTSTRLADQSETAASRPIGDGRRPTNDDAPH